MRRLTKRRCARRPKRGANPNIGQIIASMWEARMDEVHENIFTSSALYEQFFMENQPHYTSDALGARYYQSLPDEPMSVSLRTPR